ncbi:MAG: O-antigen ligase family protein [Planctomycetota bacterium]
MAVASQTNYPNAELARSSSPLASILAPFADVGAPKWLFGAAVAAAASFNTVDVNYGYTTGEDHVGLDWQVAIKLIIGLGCAGLGGLAVIFSDRTRRALFAFPGCVLVGLALTLILASLVALPEARTVSRVASVINFGYVLFVAGALSVLGLKRTITIVLLALVANLMANWALYLALPNSIGVFEEELAGKTFVRRMGGLGHPNSIARTAVSAGIIALAMLRSRVLVPTVQTGRLFLVSIVILSAATLVATYSRTSVVAWMTASGFLMIDKIFTRRGMVCISFVLALGLLAGVGYELFGGGVSGKSVLAIFTKTGDVEELTSATGRTAIWLESIRLIGLSPITGYGLNSAPFLLVDHSLHTHNIVLHALFSGGILAGILMAGLLSWNLFRGLISSEPLVRAVCMYILVSGTFEDTAVDTFASPSTLLWYVVLLVPAIEALMVRGVSAAPAESHTAPLSTSPELAPTS